MSRIETLDDSNWQDLVNADPAVLILAKTDCKACAAWSEELESALADGATLPDVRIGKLYLDQRGTREFKKANPWIAEVDDLPFNVIYSGGERRKSFAGGGFDRLRNRIERLGQA